MNILPKSKTIKSVSEQFNGDVWGDLLLVPQNEDQRAAMVKARYAPGARSAWHSHARGQFLHITQGVALCGSRDGTVYEVHPGETYYCQPGEEHWHAAESDCFMELLGVMEDADDPDTTTNGSSMSPTMSTTPRASVDSARTWLVKGLRPYVSRYVLSRGSPHRRRTLCRPMSSRPQREKQRHRAGVTRVCRAYDVLGADRSHPDHGRCPQTDQPQRNSTSGRSLLPHVFSAPT